jgi:hypothetical protein
MFDRELTSLGNDLDRREHDHDGEQDKKSDRQQGKHGILLGGRENLGIG